MGEGSARWMKQSPAMITPTPERRCPSREKAAYEMRLDFFQLPNLEDLRCPGIDLLPDDTRPEKVSKSEPPLR